MSPPRRKCVFNSNLQNEFTFIKPTSISPHIVYCEVCKSEFDISNSGRSNIKNHINKKNTKYLALNAASSSQKVNHFFKNDDLTTENLQLAAKEGTLAYHTIKHMQSFRSFDCTSKLLATLFERNFLWVELKLNV